VTGATPADTAIPFAAARPADQVSLRRDNLATVLGLLRSDGPWSRPRIAEKTGLNRATVSTLVTELAARGLVEVGETRRDGTPGRPGQAVTLDGRRHWGLGLEVNACHVAATAFDVAGRVTFDRRVPIARASDGVAAVVDRIVDLADSTVRAAEQSGARVLEMHVAIPGLVDEEQGRVVLAPNMGWLGVPLRDEIAAGLGAAVPVRIANDANLSALAEHALGHAAGVPDLVYLTGEVGVGAGVIVNGELMRGAEGFAGEVGHLPLDPSGRDCGCGRRGCWETMVGFEAVLRKAAAEDDPMRNPAVDIEQRVDEIGRRAASGDRQTLDALHAVGLGLGLGASFLVNLFNPRVLVLGGYFARLSPFLLEPMRTEMAARIVAPGLGGCAVAPSNLGFTTAARGGALLALRSVFADPTSVDILTGGGQ